MIQWMLAIWSLVPLPFLNQASTCGSSQFICYWSLEFWALFWCFLRPTRLRTPGCLLLGRVITPSWLSGSLRSFLHSSSMYFCHLFLISSASVRSIPFLSFIVSIFAWHVPLGVSNFLEEISSLVLLYFALKKAFLSFLAILWNSAFRWVYLSFSPLLLPSLLFSAVCKASSENCFAFLHFFFLGMLSYLNYHLFPDKLILLWINVGKVINIANL